MDALYDKVDNIYEGKSKKYNTKMSLMDFGKKYTGNENVEYGKLLADVLQVKSDTPLEMIDPTKLSHGIMRVEDNKLYKKLFPKDEHKEVKKIVSTIPVPKKQTLAKGFMGQDIRPTEPIIPSIQDKKKLEVIGNNTHDVVDDILEWGKRGLVKAGLMDVYGTEEIKTKPIIPKTTTVKKDNYEEVQNSFANIGDVNSVKGNNEKYSAFQNKFDRNKGFNYVPIANVNNSNATTKYQNVKGIAHFTLDTDLKNNYQHEYAKEMIDKQKRGENIEKGSTVKDQFVVVKENIGNKVNIKYKHLSEVKDKSKIATPLRQYRYTDLDWNKRIKPPDFKMNVSSIPTKSGVASHFIFPNTENGKDTYGKFGGGSVVFLANGKNFAVDFAGSINQIQEAAKQIIENEHIKPEDLVIAYHDLGSFSAKPKAKKDNTLSFNQWSDFNNDKWVGGGLAFPSN